MKNFGERMDEKKYEFTQENIKYMFMHFSTLLTSKILLSYVTGELMDSKNISKLVDDFIENNIKPQE